MALTEKTMKELYEIAKGMGVKNVKIYRKADLVSLIMGMGYTTTSQEDTNESIETPNEIKSVTTAGIVQRAIQSIRNVFRFDHSRANIGDVFTKRMGESKIRLNVTDSDKKSTTMVTNKGIRLKVLK